MKSIASTKRIFRFSNEKPPNSEIIPKAKVMPTLIPEQHPQKNISKEKHVLLTAFFNELSIYLPVCGLTFFGQKEIVTSEGTRTGNYSKSIELVTPDEISLGRLQFDLKDKLSPPEETEFIEIVQRLTLSLSKILAVPQRLCYQKLRDEIPLLYNFPIAFQNTVKNNFLHEKAFSLLLLEFEHLQSVNERFGQPAYEQVLKSLSASLLNGINEEDQIFRYHEDQFVILLNKKESINNDNIINSIKNEILTNPLLLRFGISCHIGKSSSQKEDDFSHFYLRAAKALCFAKNSRKIKYTNDIETNKKVINLTY